MNLVSCLFFFVVEDSSLQSSSQEIMNEQDVFDLEQEVRLSCSYVIHIETGVTPCHEGEIMLIIVTIPFNILHVVQHEFVTVISIIVIGNWVFSGEISYRKDGF